MKTWVAESKVLGASAGLQIVCQCLHETNGGMAV